MIFGNKWLIEFCQQVEKENGLLGGYKAGDRVVKLSDDIVVKYGYDMTASEARTQEFAYSKANPSIFHVPRVYYYLFA